MEGRSKIYHKWKLKTWKAKNGHCGILFEIEPMTDPWDWYLSLRVWLIFMVHVGIPYMDPIGLIFMFFVGEC